MSTEKLVTPTETKTIATPLMEAIEAVSRQGARALRTKNQPQEWKLISLRECPTPEDLQLCDTPDRAAAYWRNHISTHPFFNPECECLVVLMLNTRRRIKGHCFISIGTMDTILVHPREVFRLAVIASAAGGLLTGISIGLFVGARVTDTAHGTIRSLEATVQGFEEKATKLDTDIADTQKRAKELEAKVGAPFEHDERYHRLTERQQEIEERLDLTKNQAPSASDSEIAATHKASELDAVNSHSPDDQGRRRQLKQRRGVRV